MPDIGKEAYAITQKMLPGFPVWRSQLIAIDSFDDTSKWSFNAADGTATTPWTVSSNKMTSSGGALSLDTFAFYKNAKLSDGKVQVVIENPDPSSGVASSYAGIILRAKTLSDVIAVLLYNSGKLELGRYNNGTYSTLATSTLTGLDVALTTNTVMLLEVELTGDNIKAYLNGRKLIDNNNAQNKWYAYGYCGLATHKLWAGSFSNFSIREKRFDTIPRTIKKGLCIGSSITRGQEQPIPWVTTLGKRINDEFATQPFTMINGGIDGNTSADMIGRISTLLTTHQPEIVLIEASVNDSRVDRSITLTQSIEYLRGMIKLVKGAGAIPLISTATPIGPDVSNAAYDSNSFRKVYLMNCKVRELAAQEHIRLIENFNAFNGDFSLIHATDKIHPIASGAAVIADNAFRTIAGLN